MLHNEMLRKADESYEIRHDHHGNAIHVYIKDGDAIVFPSLWDLIQYEFMGGSNIERFYVAEEQLSDLYDSESYSYYTLKEFAQRVNQ
jgi:hypothetical protein